MKGHRIALGILLAGVVSSLGMAADEPLPKGAEILDKFVDATGGKDAYLKVHNEMWKGSFEFLGKGIKGAATSYRAEPRVRRHPDKRARRRSAPRTA